jgi:rod shape determining protein RodA
MSFERLHLDRTLFYALATLALVSLLTVYSASGKDLGVAGAHVVRLLVGFGIMLAVAQVRPEQFERWSPWLYAIGLVLLVLVLAVGTVGKGAQRWLNLGFVRFQPSEIMKLALPMMLAWYLARADLPPTLLRLAVGFLIAVVPAALIAKQPDLGTAVLVFAAGAFTLFLAGMRWGVIIAVGVAAAAVAPIVWNHMHDYQRHRIFTLFDPESDPLGTGYHTIQSMIAVGSGGFYGKGWLNSSQAHLEYLPEAGTDFIYAVFAEEFGLIGSLLLLGIYVFIGLRAMLIAFYAQNAHARLLAGGLGLIFFFSFFVNIGMVLGILPIVGVPLPVMSYGGTSIVTVMASFGILMSIQMHRRIAEHR